MTPKQQLGTDLLSAYKSGGLSDRCLYADPEGKHCAVGWLLGEELAKDLASRGWNMLRIGLLCRDSSHVRQKIESLGLTAAEADRIQVAFDSEVYCTQSLKEFVDFEGVVKEVFDLTPKEQK